MMSSSMTLRSRTSFIYATFREYRYSDEFKSIYSNLWIIFTFLAIKISKQGTEDTEMVHFSVVLIRN